MGHFLTCCDEFLFHEEIRHEGVDRTVLAALFGYPFLVVIFDWPLLREIFNLTSRLFLDCDTDYCTHSSCIVGGLTMKAHMQTTANRCV